MLKPEVVVLRYGHRVGRDERVTTHCCLVARAFGARKIIIQGLRDEELIKRVEQLTERWGGSFSVEFSESWRKVVSEYKAGGFVVVHLTMYGLPLKDVLPKIKKKKVLVIIGAKKVEAGVYEDSDFNVSIGKQPHSEIAALAVFLDNFFEGRELELEFENAKIRADKKKWC
jgi:tRNA (cytidine56-2'-O)-methyltransferase